jgi:RecB family exonuclease
MDAIDIRASSLGEMFDCPARWYARNVERIKSPSSGAAQLGTSLHAGTGLYDSSRIADGTPASIEDALDCFVDAVRNPAEEVAWTDITPAQAIDRGVLLVTRYCREIAPTRAYQAVELQCDPLPIRAENGVLITLTGTADRIRVLDDKRGIADLKSGARIVKDGAVDVDKHAVQLGTYELIEVLVKQTTGEDMLLDAEIIALPTKGPAVPVTATVRRPSRLLLGDNDHPGLLDVAAAMAKSEAFFGNPKSVLCSAKYCPAYAKCWWRAKD